MIVARITIARHHGCWASDTSSLFPTIKFLLFLQYIDGDHYEVGLKLIPQDEEAKKNIPEVWMKVSSHNTWRENSPEISENTRIITIRDRGKAEGIIRSVIFESGTFFPKYQAMIIDNGKETIYAAFSGKKALTHVKNELTTKYGTHNIEITTLRENVSEANIIDFVPTWYEYYVDKAFADLIKESIKSAAMGVKLEPSKLEQLKDFLLAHPELIALFLDNLNKFYDYVRRLLFGLPR